MTKQPKEKPVVTLDSPSVTVVIDSKKYTVSFNHEGIFIGCIDGVKIINSKENWLLIK